MFNNSPALKLHWLVEGRKEGNVLFNDALNTFYLRLYGVTHMVKHHSDSERWNPLPPHGLLFPIISKFFFYMHHPTDRITHTMAFATQIAQWVQGAGHSSEVEHSLMVRWVVGSILHGVDPLSYFSFQPVLHDWCNKGYGMYYPVCGMVHIKEPLLLIDKSSLCGGSGFPFSLSEWSLTICLTPYNRR